MADSRISPTMGLIVNPVAGLGGLVGLHGSDGELAHKALELGAKPTAGMRAMRAIRRLAVLRPDLALVTAGGPMGADLIEDSDRVRVLPVGDPTSAEDTRKTALAMRDIGVDLILFAGGDGTASDIVSAVGREIPILGIPTGVKMHSGVFGTTPESAGELAAQFLSGDAGTRDAEVVDVAEPRGHDDSGPVVIAAALVPNSRSLLQQAKAVRGADGEAALRALARELVAGFRDDDCVVVGPGTSVGVVMEEMGLVPTLNGVDVVKARQVVLSDANEGDLFALLGDCPRATLLLGVIGGQGFLLGRGNQQVSPRVVGRIGEGNVVIIASERKVLALDPPVLLVDVGAEQAEPVLSGYRRVLTGPGRSVIMRIVHS